MRVFRPILVITILFLAISSIKAQDSNNVYYSLFLETSVSFGTLDTKVDEGEFKEGENFIIPDAELIGAFEIYQDLYNALVGGKFGIDYGALNNDIEMKMFIRNLDTLTGTYSSFGSEEDTLFSYFEIRIWEYPQTDSSYYPEESSFYFNDGYAATFVLPKSEALSNFLDIVGIGNQESLGFAFMENVDKSDDDWNGFGIESTDNPDSIKFEAIHLSRIGGGRKTISDRNDYDNTVVGIEIINLEGIPNKIDLGQNFPNPFNPTTKISYSLKDKGQVSLNVFNILGKHVLTLVNDNLSAGNYEVEFSTNNDKNILPSGVYIYTLNSNNTRISKKMILMK